MDRTKTLLILAVAWVSAGLLAWFVWANAAAPKSEPQTLVVVASHDLALGTLLKKDDLKLAGVPEKTAPKGALLRVDEAAGRVLLTPLNTNEPLVASRVSGKTTSEGMASTIEKGYRAVSVQITDVTGVAGLIQANSHVDVIFTHMGTMDEASTSTILQNVRVLSTGRVAPANQTAQTAAADARTPRAPVVTLLLKPEEAQKLELAKNQGRISLSLRNPQDDETAEVGDPITPAVLDPTYDQRASAARKKRAPQRDTSNDEAAFARLAALRKQQDVTVKKEPEKPRVVVDVFRGDKHVQESFK